MKVRKAKTTNYSSHYFKILSSKNKPKLMQNSNIIFGLISRKSKNKNLKTLFIEGDDGGGAKKI